jgi:hypothetical protein
VLVLLRASSHRVYRRDCFGQALEESIEPSLASSSSGRGATRGVRSLFQERLKSKTFSLMPYYVYAPKVKPKVQTDEEKIEGGQSTYIHRIITYAS